MGDRLTDDIAIIGGGWAGLAAAVSLADAGRRVTLLESARQLGGRARSVAWNGLAIDNGQHLMAGAYRQTLALMERLGTLPLLERRRLELRAPDFTLALPHLPAPLHLATGLLRADGLAAADKLAAIRFMRSLKRSRFRLAADMPATRFLARHRQPHRLVDRVWEPICVAALNTPLAMASAQVFCNVLRDSLAGDREDSDMLFNRADMGRLLPDAAQSRLTASGSVVRTSCRVEKLLFEDGRFRLSGPDIEAKQVVVATHPARVPSILEGIEAARETSSALARFTWQPILTSWLRFASPIAFPYPMLALGHGAAPWAFERNDLAPGLVSIVASAEGPHLLEPPEALLEEHMKRLSTALGPLPPLLDRKTIVERRATFACTPDLKRPPNVTPVPGLYLAGDYTAGDYPATLEGAVRSGVKCAQIIQERT